MPLSSLPTELLLQIALALEDRHDALQLRLASTKFDKVGLEAFAKSTTKSYVEKSQASIARFQQFCLHPLLSQYIKEVIYIAAETYKEGDDGNPRIDGREKCFERYAKRYTGYESNADYAKHAYDRICREQQNGVPLVGPLSVNFARLPRLEKFSVQGTPLMTLPRWYMRNREFDVDDDGWKMAHNVPRMWRNYTLTKRAGEHL